MRLAQAFEAGPRKKKRQDTVQSGGERKDDCDDGIGQGRMMGFVCR